MRSGRHHRTQDPGRWSCRSARSSQRASFPLRPFPQRTKRTETRSDHCHEARQAQTLAQPRQTAPAAFGRRMGQRRHHHTWDPGRWSCRSPRSSQRASPARSEGRVHRSTRSRRLRSTRSGRKARCDHRMSRKKENCEGEMTPFRVSLRTHCVTAIFIIGRVRVIWVLRTSMGLEND